MRYLVEGPHRWTIVDAADPEQAAVDAFESIRIADSVAAVTVTPIDDTNQATIRVRRKIEIA